MHSLSNDMHLITTWSYWQHDPMVEIVSEVGISHNRATHLRWSFEGQPYHSMQDSKGWNIGQTNMEIICHHRQLWMICSNLHINYTLPRLIGIQYKVDALRQGCPTNKHFIHSAPPPPHMDRSSSSSICIPIVDTFISTMAIKLANHVNCQLKL